MSDHSITRAEIDAAHRGLRLDLRDDVHLAQTIEDHSTGAFAHMFASKVIVAAAREEQERRKS